MRSIHMTSTIDILPRLYAAAGSVGYKHLSLTLKRPVQYTFNRLNHLGEVVDTIRDFNYEISIELLSRWDVPQMMTTDPYKTIDKFFDEVKDKAATVLFDLSLTHSALDVSWNRTDKDSDIVIWLNESHDHQTNIDADFIDLVLDIIERKRQWWRILLNRMN